MAAIRSQIILCYWKRDRNDCIQFGNPENYCLFFIENDDSVNQLLNQPYKLCMNVASRSASV